jgi:LmbE family N-acetylglucosaminyl deacetylase
MKKIPETFTKPILTFLIFLSALPAIAQVTSLSSAEIFLNIKKLNVVGSVLHLAAHPDDENTLLLTYLSKDQLVRTGYLSLTRGDGGQNLIGPEQGYNIGVIRTQELLGARKMDGAQQFFSRAYDFGFSKTREETLNFWDENKVLGDVVWLIRKFQPDVIVNRFPPDPRAGHGHHQTSAYLGEKAFEMAADKNAFPDQLKHVKTWQAKRLVWNTFSPGFTNKAPAAEKSTYISIPINGYNPVLGTSYSEISALSRSQHKSQGFGSAPSRGERIDYFLHKAGEPASKSIFDGIDLTWKRISGSTQVQETVTALIKNYNVNEPSASLPALLKLDRQLSRLDSSDINVKAKKQEVQDLIIQCSGLWFESNPVSFSATPGDYERVNIGVVNRSAYPVKLVSVRWTGGMKDSILNLSLTEGQETRFAVNPSIPTDLKISQPYWLRKPIVKGMFQIDNQHDINYPENRPETVSTFVFEMDGQQFSVTRPWVYKSTDPAEGEIYRPFEIRPAVTINIGEPVYIFASALPKMINVAVEAQKENLNGTVKLNIPAGWKSEPASYEFAIPGKNQIQNFTFLITPPEKDQEVRLTASAVVNGQTYSKAVKTIAYHHIPSQTIFPDAEAKLAKIDVRTTVKNVGYIAGAGDDVPAALRQMGCQVTMLDGSELGKDLSVYEAIVVGVRAYNTVGMLSHYQSKLMEYVKNGGTMIVQYTIPGNMTVANIGPYPLTTGRERITEEDAVMKFLLPDHKLLNYPNKITQKDFDGWIQERGLYFGLDWDKTRYQALLAGNDTDETTKEGSLLYAQYGKGHYIYTGLSFFRELPAGVTGAYRLFANMISVGKK